MKKRLLIGLGSLILISTFANADLKTTYQAGYQNALVYWSNGVTVTSTEDIESTAEVKANRNGYQQKSPDRDAFIRGWCDGTNKLLQSSNTTATSKEEQLPTVEWAREMLRQQIAAYQGVPVDRYQPMPCIALRSRLQVFAGHARFQLEFPKVDGEHCWEADFKYDGKTAWLKGHGTTIFEVGMEEYGVISQTVEGAEFEQQVQQQLQDLVKDIQQSAGGLRSGVTDVYGH
jgi:hypothetical protein